MKAFRYAFFGLLVGAFLGAIIGSGNLFHRHIIKQQMRADFASWKWTILGAVVGACLMAYIGSKADKKEASKKEV